jgi:hypothetical protein
MTMTRKPLLIAPLAVVLCAFAPGEVAAAVHSGSLAIERAAPARVPTISRPRRP